MVPKARLARTSVLLRFGTILFGMGPKESSCSVQKGSGLEPFCLTWYQRYDIAMLFFVDLEPF